MPSSFSTPVSPFTLAESHALAETGGEAPSSATLHAEAALARARRADPGHLRFRLATFSAAVHAPDADLEAQRACRSVELGDRAILRFGHIVRAHRELRDIDRALDTALRGRTEEIEEGIRALLDRWDSEGESLAFRRERVALGALAQLLTLPAPVAAALSEAEDAILLRSLGLDEHEDAPERLAIGRALADETRLLGVEVVRTRARWSAEALAHLFAWGAKEVPLPHSPGRLFASLDQTSRHLVALHDDVHALAMHAGRCDLERRLIPLVSWARTERLIGEGAEVVLLQAPLHTRGLRR